MAHHPKPQHADNSGLVPRHLNYGAVTTPFVYQTLSALEWLSDDQSVQQYVQANRPAQGAVIALSQAVCNAGIRVCGQLRPDHAFDEHLRLYSAEEIWMVDLAIDVVAMFAVNGGLRPENRESVTDKVRRVDEHAHSHHWKHLVHSAGAGPAQFQELRALIPHHKPHR